LALTCGTSVDDVTNANSTGEKQDGSDEPNHPTLFAHMAEIVCFGLSENYLRHSDRAWD
jgi:hypothetical protein